jgi:hypothetical protein
MDVCGISAGYLRDICGISAMIIAHVECSMIGSNNISTIKTLTPEFCTLCPPESPGTG